MAGCPTLNAVSYVTADSGGDRVKSRDTSRESDRARPLRGPKVCKARILGMSGMNKLPDNLVLFSKKCISAESEQFHFVQSLAVAVSSLAMSHQITPGIRISAIPCICQVNSHRYFTVYLVLSRIIRATTLGLLVRISLFILMLSYQDRAVHAV